MRELADRGVGIEPQQLSFRVVVLTATPVAIVRRVAAQDLRRDGGVFEVAPRAAGLLIEIRSRERQRFLVLLRRQQTAARRQYAAPILRHALVDPQQVTALRRGVIRRRQTEGAAILSIPRVRE